MEICQPEVVETGSRRCLLMDSCKRGESPLSLLDGAFCFAGRLNAVSKRIFHLSRIRSPRCNVFFFFFFPFSEDSKVIHRAGTPRGNVVDSKARRKSTAHRKRAKCRDRLKGIRINSRGIYRAAGEPPSRERRSREKRKEKGRRRSLRRRREIGCRYGKRNERKKVERKRSVRARLQRFSAGIRAAPRR